MVLDPIFQYQAGNSAKFSCIMGYDNQISCDALSAYHHVIGSYRRTAKCKLCSKFAKIYRVHLVEWDDFIIRKKRLQHLSGTFSPSTFCRSILKLPDRNG